MTALADVLAALGRGLVRPLVPGPAGVQVTDIVIAEPGDADRDLTGDLVLGPAVVDAAGARDLLRRAAASGAAGVSCAGPRPALAGCARPPGRWGSPCSSSTTRRPWCRSSRCWGTSSARSSATGPARPDVGVEGDLLVLADAAAGLVDAPVTIEDAQSRVLAYSSRQDVTDTARVSTIVGRRVPADLVAAHAVERRVPPVWPGPTSRSSSAPAPARSGPRFVVPVRAGGEWLGSIWAVVGEPPPAVVVVELRRAATVVALHLLRMRAQADLTRRVTAQRLRDLLGGESDAVETLAASPWRVVVLGAGSGGARRRARPVGRAPTPVRLAAAPRDDPRRPGLRGRVRRTAVAPSRQAPAGPGVGWLRLVAASVVDDDDTPARRPGSARARPPSTPLDSCGRGGWPTSSPPCAGPSTPRPVLTAEDCWATLTTARAVAAVGDPDRFAGPVPVLRRHDEERHTAYLPSLAAWLDHPGEPTAAARALGVHVNTLRYRMVRMSEIADLPLDDPTARLALRLQLRALGH